MSNIVVGMGRMGQAFSRLLPNTIGGDTLADVNSLVCDGDTIFSCVPYYATLEVAHYAAKHGAHYVDLTEDIGTRETVRSIAATAPRQLFISGTGLAPGYVNMIAGRLTRAARRPISVEMFCGALPQNATCNELGYQISWSLDGLMREYTALSEARIDNEVNFYVPFSGYRQEHFGSWPTLEAFHTSGGAGTTPRTLSVRTVTYSTLRYPGHAKGLRPLLHSSEAVHRACGNLDGPDVVYLAVKVRERDRELQHLEKILPQRGLTAIQYATAKGAIETWQTAHATGRAGFVRPEEL